MKRLVSLFFACAAFLCAALSGGAPARAANAADGLDSDALYRLRLRLDDLGYFDAPAPEVADEALSLALEGFSGDAEGAPALLGAVFAANAPARALNASHVFNAPAPAQALIGRLSDWETVRTKLAMGASYVVTSCVSGSVLHASYDDGEAGFAAMTPVSPWDAATVLGLFGDLRSLDKHPVTVAIGSARIAASLTLDPRADAADAINAGQFRLYFENAPAHVGGLTDAEHQAVVLTAGY